MDLQEISRQNGSVLPVPWLHYLSPRPRRKDKSLKKEQQLLCLEEMKMPNRYALLISITTKHWWVIAPLTMDLLLVANFSAEGQRLTNPSSTCYAVAWVNGLSRTWWCSCFYSWSTAYSCLWWWRARIQHSTDLLNRISEAKIESIKTWLHLGSLPLAINQLDLVYIYWNNSKNSQ